MKFPESGLLHLLFKTPKELEQVLASVEEPYEVINVYGVSPSRHYVAIKKSKEATDENVHELKKLKKTGG